jgi:DNA polymerase (family 10)
LAQAAAERGFHSIAVTDHSKSQVQANGLTAARLEQHIQDVHAVAKELAGKIVVLTGTEVDILADGKLDYPDSLLKELDVVVASPHAALTQEADKATPRLLKAIENPHVTILGHATGRLILRREGMKPDMQALAKAAARTGVAMEINANHYRLDLRDTHARVALESGCRLSINTDAHSPADLNELIYGVLTARRAGATREQVINCMGPDELTGYLRRTRRQK